MGGRYPLVPDVAIGGEQSLGEVKPGKKVVKARKVNKGGVEKPWGW